MIPLNYRHTAAELRDYGTDAEIIATFKRMSSTGILPAFTTLGRAQMADINDITSVDEIHLDDNGYRTMMKAMKPNSDDDNNHYGTTGTQTSGGYYDHRWEDDPHDRYMVDWYRKHGAKSDATR